MDRDVALRARQTPDRSGRAASDVVPLEPAPRRDRRTGPCSSRRRRDRRCSPTRAASCAELAKLFPENVPPPLAVDSARRWMLLADLGPELGWGAPLEVREEVLQVFARMQIESAAHADDLLGLGCVDRRLEVLASEARDLLADDASLWPASMPRRSRKRARSGSKVDALCEGLAESGMPSTLLHGDLHLSNVARLDGSIPVSSTGRDASVGHPLFDLIDVFREESQAIHDQLRDVYLSAWVQHRADGPAAGHLGSGAAARVPPPRGELPAHPRERRARC